MTSGPATILVVDDTPASRYATARTLRRVGFNVVEAVSGEEAIRLAVEHNVDLIVLDINLPGNNGYEVCREIRTNRSAKNVRVVYLSASFVDDEHKVQGYEAGADGFLTNPVEPTVLIATVNAQLRTRAVELQLSELLKREREISEQAQTANRVKDEFLATLSHELRNPLNAIVGWAEVARLHKPDAEVERALQVIVRNARLQTQLISDLLDVSRITTGKLALDREPVMIADTVHAVIDTMRSAAQQRSIRLETSVDGTAGVVLGDVTRIEQIVTNLVSNAIKFSESERTVFVTLDRVGDSARLVVRDEGKGIEAEALPMIFERFWQADTSSRRSHSGLGLGLAIVKHLTEMHGGTVAVASPGSGRGATFTVTLPILPGAVAAWPAGREVVDKSAPNLSGMRILIVDDDEDGRNWLRRLVIGAGAQAIDVADVASAISAVEKFEPHVLVSDLAMPFADGFDLIGLLRSRGHSPARLPAVALSAFGDAEHQHRALGASFQTFHAKPPDPAALLETLARYRPADGKGA